MTAELALVAFPLKLALTTLAVKFPLASLRTTAVETFSDVAALAI